MENGRLFALVSLVLLASAQARAGDEVKATNGKSAVECANTLTPAATHQAEESKTSYLMEVIKSGEALDYEAIALLLQGTGVDINHSFDIIPMADTGSYVIEVFASPEAYARAEKLPGIKFYANAQTAPVNAPLAPPAPTMPLVAPIVASAVAAPSQGLLRARPLPQPNAHADYSKLRGNAPFDLAPPDRIFSFSVNLTGIKNQAELDGFMQYLKEHGFSAASANFNHAGIIVTMRASKALIQTLTLMDQVKSISLSSPMRPI